MKKTSVYILGISAFYHDSSACIIKNGKVLAAVQEERFTRQKHDESFPSQAIDYCLDFAGIKTKDLSFVVFYEKPILKFDRLLKTYIRTWPWGFVSFYRAMKTWLGGKLWIESLIQKNLNYKNPIYFVPHHLSHGAASFYTSGFDQATIITIDGVGEWATTSIGEGQKNQVKLHEEIHFPDSLGLLYSSFTYYLGFKVNSAEYKVMGLAPYGKPRYKQKIYKLLDCFDDGSFALKSSFFTYSYTLKMIGKKFEKHFNMPRRKKEASLTSFYKDIAASLQEVTNEIMLGVVKRAYQNFPNKNLCLSGGVALNCVTNSFLQKNGPFENLYIFPASGDAGGSVGAGLYLYHHILEKARTKNIDSIYLGPKFSDSQIKSFLKHYKIPSHHYNNASLISKISQEIDNNKIIGLFQGRMEFGPRALGNRSIIADARREENWKRVNLKIKFRESFRPFAPSVLEEKSTEYFDLGYSPYMLFTTQTKSTKIPAVTHKDKSARVQTVNEKQNPFYYHLISDFYKRTKCPVIINTSFNVRGEPIVCTLEDTFKAYLRTEIDILVLGNFWIEQTQKQKKSFERFFTFQKFEDD